MFKYYINKKETDRITFLKNCSVEKLEQSEKALRSGIISQITFADLYGKKKQLTIKNVNNPFGIEMHHFG